MAEKGFLGIDWGSVDVGIAVADPETRIALTCTTLRNDEQLLQRIAEIIEREDVGTVVIGIPSHVNRVMVEYEGEKLGKLLTAFLPELRIAYQDEMFTTKMAQHNLIERGMKNVSKHDDEEAARIILQEWLDRQVGDRR
jgi:putative Holliday junction resolvase